MVASETVAVRIAIAVRPFEDDDYDDDDDLSLDLHSALLYAWKDWMYTQHAIICRHLLFFRLTL